MITKDEWIRLCAEVCGQDDASTEAERKRFMKVATRARFKIEEISAALDARSRPEQGRRAARSVIVGRDA